MKRSKQAQKIIDSVNYYLRVNHINDESNIVFIVFDYALINAGIYNGFNCFTDDDHLSGGVNTDHLQFY